MLDAGDARAVGQSQVEQHAVDVARHPAGVGQSGHPLDLDAGQSVGQQLPHEQRVAVVVLDEQQSPRRRRAELGRDLTERVRDGWAPGDGHREILSHEESYPADRAPVSGG